MKDDLVNNISHFFLLWVKYPGRLLLLIKSPPLYTWGSAQQKHAYKMEFTLRHPSCQIIHGDLVNNILFFFLLWVKYPDRLLLLIKSPPLSTVYLGICTTTQTFILYFTFR
jgi:hypothetical protein